MFTAWFRSMMSCECIIIDLLESIIATIYNILYITYIINVKSSILIEHRED